MESSKQIESLHRELDRLCIPRTDNSLGLTLTAKGRVTLALTGSTLPGRALKAGVAEQLAQGVRSGALV